MILRCLVVCLSLARAAAFFQPQYNTPTALTVRHASPVIASSKIDMSPPGYLAGTSLDAPDITWRLSEGHYLETSPLTFKPAKLSFPDKFTEWLALRLKPRGRLPFNRALCLKIKGGLPLANPQSFNNVYDESTLTGINKALLNAAHDSRIDAIYLKVEDLAAGTASLQEIRRHMDYFRSSGKPIIGFSPRVITINQLYLLGGCDKRYIVPEAYLDITGFSLPVDFYRGVFDKVGIEPQVQRIGEYKSFGDTYARTSMSDAQRETLENLLDKVSTHKLAQLARDSSSSVQDMEKLLLEETKVLTPKDLVEAGFVTDLLYEEDVFKVVSRELDAAKAKKAWFKGFGKGEEKDSSYDSEDDMEEVDPEDILIGPGTYLKNLSKLPLKRAPGERGDALVAVIVAEGGIVEKDGDSAGASDLVVDKFKENVKVVMDDPRVAGVVVRINSPGGDALASDIMWHHVCRIKETGKPVVASICNVAASGGYYIAMGCDKIVAEEQSITGSIGIVSAKFNAKELLKKIGYNVERLSKGRFSEVMAFERGFTPEEEAYFSTSAMMSYENFVSKAAISRGMPVDKMHRRSQGRVWTGEEGRGLGLVDEIGGLNTAIELARDLIDRRKMETKVYTRALKKDKALNKKIIEASSEKFRFKDWSDVTYFKKKVDKALQEELQPALDAEIAIQEAIRGKVLERKPRETKIKYVTPARDIFGLLLKLILRNGVTASAKTENVLDLLKLKNSVMSGRPMALMDNDVGKAFEGVGCVPEQLRTAGIGPLEYAIFGRSPEIIKKFFGEVFQIGLTTLL